jgi:homoserine dehydrogenase
MNQPSRHLLDEIEAFLAETGVSPTLFGYAVMSDPTFVPNLRQGREPRSATITKARQGMAAYRATGEFGAFRRAESPA